ncbi:MAG: ABC transporter ATP-binding protein [Oscillospiraceae bacterium]|nr:ABC transporter ATP-binding protein [Oscillospiraceae bacterium]
MKKERNKPRSKWIKFISYYRPYLGLFTSDMFFAFLGAVVSLMIPLVIRYITSDVIFRPESEALKTIIMLSALMIGLILVECYSNFYMAFYGHMMGAKMEYNMRSEIFAHFQKLPNSFYDDRKVGSLMSRITNDLFEISELFHHGPEDIVISIIKLFGSLVILISVNANLAAVAFAVIPFMILFAVKYNIKMKRAFKRNRERIAEINAGIEDNLSGIRVVKSFANEDIEQRKFTEGNDRFLESKKDSYYYMGIYHAGLGAFTSFINIAVIATGTVFITLKIIDVTDLITFLLYINNFTEPVRKLINFTEQFQNGATGYERFLEILNVDPQIKDKPGAVEIGRADGAVKFHNVGFHYESNNAMVLKDIDLYVSVGEYVALVGPSGVGKTTLCSLIPRFYDVTEGCILLDGRDIRDITLKSLRDNIGIVQQDVYLFSGTVEENIRYGRPGASDDEIIEAAKKANAHNFIMTLPGGYKTDIGQRGVKLSGGQKQRISIARVFLKNPPVLIFDEATSSLDNESERVVQESLEKLAEHRTTFVIAHRLSTIRNAERILVLGENGIAESGTHNELIKLGGVYASLYRLASCQE